MPLVFFKFHFSCYFRWRVTCEFLHFVACSTFLFAFFFRFLCTYCASVCIALLALLWLSRFRISSKCCQSDFFHFSLLFLCSFWNTHCYFCGFCSVNIKQFHCTVENITQEIKKFERNHYLVKNYDYSKLFLEGKRDNNICIKIRVV